MVRCVNRQFGRDTVEYIRGRRWVADSAPNPKLPQKLALLISNCQFSPRSTGSQG